VLFYNSSAMKDLITVVGLVLVLEGLPYFAFPETFKTWIGRILELPESRLRVYGLISMMGGLFLIYLARRSGWLTG
jgi:uncharacterized protein YjeT (DUF2065 family)